MDYLFYQRIIKTFASIPMQWASDRVFNKKKRKKKKCYLDSIQFLVRFRKIYLNSFRIFLNISYASSRKMFNSLVSVSCFIETTNISRISSLKKKKTFDTNGLQQSLLATAILIIYRNAMSLAKHELYMLRYLQSNNRLVK